MARVLNTLIAIGPVVLLLALAFAISYMALGRVPRDNAGKARLGRYVLGLSVVAALAFVVGAVLGVAVFCAPESAGNLCGLGGVLGSGPLLAGAAIAIYAHLKRSARYV